MPEHCTLPANIVSQLLYNRLLLFVVFILFRFKCVYWLRWKLFLLLSFFSLSHCFIIEKWKSCVRAINLPLWFRLKYTHFNSWTLTAHDYDDVWSAISCSVHLVWRALHKRHEAINEVNSTLLPCANNSKNKCIKIIVNMSLMIEADSICNVLWFRKRFWPFCRLADQDSVPFMGALVCLSWKHLILAITSLSMDEKVIKKLIFSEKPAANER